MGKKEYEKELNITEIKSKDLISLYYEYSEHIKFLKDAKEQE